jgi:hypothetical protein
MAQPQQKIINSERNYQRSRYGDDSDLYSWEAGNNYNSSQLKNNVSQKPGNHGKRWTDDYEDSLEELFAKKVSIKEIARQLGRGESGIRHKLMNMGLLDEEDVF